MFDIGFGKLVLVFVIGLVVLGPQRLPIAVKTIVGWIRVLRSLASNVQQELTQELKFQELQDSLLKVEQASRDSLTPELRNSVAELKKTAESMQRVYTGDTQSPDEQGDKADPPQLTMAGHFHKRVTPADAATHASAPAQAPEAAGQNVSSDAVTDTISAMPSASVSISPVATRLKSGES